MKTLLSATFTLPNMPQVATAVLSTTASVAPSSPTSGTTSSTGTGTSTGTTSSFSPSTAFGANLIAWFKADSGLTNNGGAVSQWTDLSTTGTTLSTARSTSSQTVAPTYSGSAVGSGPGVTFGGSTGQTLWATAADITKLQLTPSTAFSMAFAFKFENNVSFGGLFGFTQLAAPQGWYVIETNGNIGLAIFGPGTSNVLEVTTSTPLVVGKSYIVYIAYDGSNTGAGIAIAINGSSAATTIVNATLGSDTDIASPQYFAVGGGGGQVVNGAFGGTGNDAVGEIIVLNRAMTVAELQNVDTYLDGRFKIY